MQQQPTYQPPIYVHHGPRNGYGTTALVLGLLGAVLGIIPLFAYPAIVLGLLGLIFGLLGWKRARRQEATNKGMAITGAILGAIGITLGIVGIVIVAQAVNDIREDIDQLDQQMSSIAVPPPPPVLTK